MTEERGTVKTYNIYLEGASMIKVMADQVKTATNWVSFYKNEELVARVSSSKLIGYQDQAAIPSPMG